MATWKKHKKLIVRVSTCLLILPLFLAVGNVEAVVALQKGDKGSEVKELQIRLKKAGVFKGDVTGYYDAKTEEAVKLFQKSHGLAIDGIAGPTVIGKLSRLISDSDIPDPEVVLPPSNTSTLAWELPGEEEYRRRALQAEAEAYRKRALRAEAEAEAYRNSQASPKPVKTLSTGEIQKKIEDSLNQLPVGQAFHNVPDDMQVGLEYVVEAGIAEKITQQIIDELQGDGDLTIKDKVRFDPSGVEIKLIFSPEEFKVFEVSGGKKFITLGEPAKWTWVVTPLKPGKSLITLKAIIQLKLQGDLIEKEIPPKEVVIFSDRRTVKVNLPYSLTQFVAVNWKESIGLVFGSGSLVGFLTWWFTTYREKLKKEKSVTPSASTKESPQPPKGS